MEKYSTEVVLQRFNGQLTMLGSRSGDELRRLGRRRLQRRTRASAAAAPAKASGPKESFELDDEIPF